MNFILYKGREAILWLISSKLLYSSNLYTIQKIPALSIPSAVAGETEYSQYVDLRDYRFDLYALKYYSDAVAYSFLVYQTDMNEITSEGSELTWNTAHIENMASMFQGAKF